MLTGSDFATRENPLSQTIDQHNMRQPHDGLIVPNMHARYRRRFQTPQIGKVGFRGNHLLRQVAESSHRSCLVVTSREEPAEVGPLLGERGPVRALELAGFGTEDGRALLDDKATVVLSSASPLLRLLTQGPPDDLMKEPPPPSTDRVAGPSGGRP